MTQKTTLLAGDIGGTKTLLGLYEADGGRLGLQHKERYRSGDYPRLADIVQKFLKDRKMKHAPRSACFGIAGPCQGGVCVTRNLPWVVNAEELQQDIGFEKVFLINDFESIVYGIPHLSTSDLDTLKTGVKDPVGNIAVIGAGTGLGEGFAMYDPSLKRYRVYPSEGGHTDFAPKNDEEVALLEYLRRQYGHVSYERVISGTGLINIYSFLTAGGMDEAAAELDAEIRQSSDPAAAISEYATSGRSEMCRRALAIFASVYGSEAGNLALKILPAGGVYLAGGIAAKIREFLHEGVFVASFLNKGRSRGLLENLPVSIILNPDVGLIGAAGKCLDEGAR